MARKIIKLNSYKTSLGDLSRFRRDILESIGDDIVEIKNWNTFLFTTLNVISPVNKGLKDNPESITKAAAKIVSYFYGRVKKAKLYKITDAGREEIKIMEKDVLKRYYEDILYIDKLPHPIYRDLEVKVKIDLSSINSLINRYEKDSYIKKLVSANQPPYDHEERIKHDFYKRCVAEQKNILNYYLSGIKQRALSKAGYVWPSFKSIFAVGESYRDFPYKFHNQPEMFDHLLIKEAQHRINNFYISEALRLEKLYLKNKESFYRSYFRKKKPEAIFSSIDFNLAHVPLNPGRKPIFDELKRLYKGRKWMAFFALAIPQVEGLFSEMHNVIFDGQKAKSLTDKVQKIRPFHNLSGYYFDYYQYIVPRLRNRFMHTGYEESFKLKANDLLTDLEHLLQVFYELENPLVKIKRIHTSRRQSEFVNFKGYASYFTLLSSLLPAQKAAIKKDQEDFEKNFLLGHCDSEFICLELIEQLPKMIDECKIKLEYSVELKGFVTELEDKNFKEMKLRFEDPKLLENVTDAFRISSNEIENIVCSAEFLAGYGKYLHSLKKEIVEGLNALKKQYGKFTMNVHQVKTLILDKQNEAEE
ncbi:MAG: hypothetical protein J0L69_15455 [Bacteroidetes bacterium]|nr:hypothetical protein [Bacteroidota bacterium]